MEASSLRLCWAKSVWPFCEPLAFKAIDLGNDARHRRRDVGRGRGFIRHAWLRPICGVGRHAVPQCRQRNLSDLDGYFGSRRPVPALGARRGTPLCQSAYKPKAIAAKTQSLTTEVMTRSFFIMDRACY